MRTLNLAHPSYSFILILCLILLCSLAIVFPLQISEQAPSQVFRLSAGIILMFFLTGYSLLTLVKKYLPEKISLSEEIGFSLGFSLVIAVIVTAFLSMVLVVSTFSVVLTLGSLSLIFCLLSRKKLFGYGRKSSAEQKTSIRPKNEQRFPERKTALLIVFVVTLACFIFILHPLISGSSNNLAYSFGTNSNVVDLALLVFLTSYLIFQIKKAKKPSIFLQVALFIIILLLAVKARSYPALVSFGLGDRVGIDSWDSLGHLIDFLGTGQHTYAEPFLLSYTNGQIISPPNPLPPGYFSLMGSISMLTAIDPLTLTRGVLVFGVLQTIFVFMLARKLSGDTTKGLLAALLIACGSYGSENIKFTSGALSPIAGVGLALIPFGLYIMTFAKTKLVKFLAILVAISLLYIHLASAIVYILFMFIYYFKPSKKVAFAKRFTITLRKKFTRDRAISIAAFAIVAVIVMPIVFFWYQTYSNPNAQYSIHYSERFTFVLPSAEELVYLPSFTENALFFILLFYGIASYAFSTDYRKEKTFLMLWNFSLIFLYLLLFYFNPKISYRILAYLFQAVSVTAACAFVRDVFEKRYVKMRRLLKAKATKTLLVLALLSFALIPVFIRTSSPDEVYLTQSTLQEPYYDLAVWARANLSSAGVIAVNNYSSISDPVNMLRNMGVPMIVGQNLTLYDYEQIRSNVTNLYVLDAPLFQAGIDIPTTEIVYSDQIEEEKYIRVYYLNQFLDSS
jgi:hypothetical protein